MEEVICCEPRVDTFLAEMEIDPGEAGEYKLTQKRKKRIAQGLQQCLKVSHDQRPYFPEEI